MEELGSALNCEMRLILMMLYKGSSGDRISVPSLCPTNRLVGDQMPISHGTVDPGSEPPPSAAAFGGFSAKYI